MADKVVGLQIRANAEEAVKTVGQIKTELRQAQKDAAAIGAAFGTTSKEFVQAAKRAADLKDQIQDANEAVALFDPGNKFAAVGNSLRTVAGGFSALTGAVALFGVESKEVEKSLLKVQAALAITEGLNTIADAGQAFDKLKIAIMGSSVAQKALAVSTNLTSAAFRALGITVTTTSTAFKVLRTAIITTGIGALVVGVGLLIEKLVSLTGSSEDAADAQTKLAEATKKANDAFSEQVDFIDRDIQLKIKRAKAAGASETEITKLEREAIQARITARSKEITQRINAGLEITELTKAQSADINALQDFDLDQQIKRTEATIANKKKEVLSVEEIQRKADEERKRREEELNKFKGVDDATTGAVSTATQARKAELEAQLALEEDFINRNIALVTKAQATISGINAENKRNQEEQIKIIQERERQEVEAYFNIGSALWQLGQLIGQQTAAGKALAISQAVINTWLGVTQVLRQPSLLPEPLQTINKVASIAATVAAGVNAVRNITRTNVPGAGSGGGAGASLSGSATAPVNVLPTLTRTQLDQQALNNRGNAAVRAFVVESDVSGSQDRIRRLNRQARLG